MIEISLSVAYVIVWFFDIEIFFFKAVTRKSEFRKHNKILNLVNKEFALRRLSETHFHEE